MRIYSKAAILVVVFCGFLSGCVSKTPEAESTFHLATPPLVNEDENAVIRDSPEADYNKNEYGPDIIDELPSYSTAELCEFYADADGAYSEGAMSILIERFINNPENTLDDFLLLESELQNIINEHLGLSIAAWGSTEQIQKLYEMRSLDLSEDQRKTLNDIISAYEMSR